MECVYLSLYLFLIISFPNILVQIIRKCMNKMTSTSGSFLLCLILNFVYSNLLMTLKYECYETNIIFLLGLILWFLIIFINLIIQCCNSSSIFSTVCSLGDKVENSQSLYEVINQNRYLPPKILIRCISGHTESREALDFYETYEYPVYKTVTHNNEDG